MTRYPDGIGGKSFFQKDAPGFAPDWIRTERMWSEDTQREIDYFVCDDVASLLYVINLGSIPLHLWASRAPTLERPDWCVLDLDPKGAPFDARGRGGAGGARQLCERIELPLYVKTSGSSGLHLLVPLGRQCTHEQSRSLGELLARCLVGRLPDIATITRQVSRRDGRVYVDYLQNGSGKLLVSPFCVRPLPGAPVSMPLTWREVNQEAGYPAAHDQDRCRSGCGSSKTDPLAEVLELSAGLGRGARSGCRRSWPDDHDRRDAGDPRSASAVGRVSGILLAARADAWVLYVLAHGAGAGMRHRFMEAIAGALAAAGIATLRYQFPYTEAGGRRPDPPAVLRPRSAPRWPRPRELAPDLPLVRRREVDGRANDLAVPQARGPLAGRGGLVFLGFPLHPPKQPGVSRAEHLARVAHADAVPAGNARRPGGRSASSRASAASSGHGPRSTWSRARTTRSRCSSARAEAMRRCWTSWRTGLSSGAARMGSADGDAGRLPRAGRRTPGCPVARRIAATYSGRVERVTSTTPPDSGA